MQVKLEDISCDHTSGTQWDNLQMLCNHISRMPKIKHISLVASIPHPYRSGKQKIPNPPPRFKIFNADATKTTVTTWPTRFPEAQNVHVRITLQPMSFRMGSKSTLLLLDPGCYDFYETSPKMVIINLNGSFSHQRSHAPSQRIAMSSFALFTAAL